MSNSDFIREVDEEVRRDQLEQLWKVWGKYVIAAVVLLIGSVGAFQAWRQYENAQAEASAGKVLAAHRLLTEGKTAEAAAAYAAASEGAPSGYKAVTLIQEAATRVASKDVAGAVAVYDRLAADTRIEPAFRDLSVYLAALHLVDTASAEEIERRLSALASGSSPLRFGAREIQAMSRLKAGDKAGAKTLLQALADQADAPNSLRGRAAELLAALGGADDQK